MPTVAEYLRDSLIKAGAKHAFSVTGNYVSGLNKVLSSKIDIIGTTNELSAGYAADAYARASGFGVATVTYCVGGFSILNAIAGAFAEQSPVLLISGSPGIKERNENTVLGSMVREFNCQHGVFEQVTCASTVLNDPRTAAYEIDRVIQTIKAQSRPGYIEIPRDLFDKVILNGLEAGIAKPEKKTCVEILDDVSDSVKHYLHEANKPIILVGVQVARYNLADKIMKFAEKYRIPVATTFLGKGTIDETHPLSIGVYSGSSSKECVKNAVDESDCLLMIGVLETDVNTGFYPMKINNRNTVLVTDDEVRIKRACYDEIRLCDFVDSLSYMDDIGKVFAGASKIPKEPSYIPITDNPAVPITVHSLMSKVSEVIGNGTPILADPGDSMFATVDLTVKGSTAYFCPAYYTTMGFSVPGSLGVMLAIPGSRPFVFVGDGSFQMTGQEIGTLASRGLNPIIFILNNGGYLTERVLSDGKWNDIPNWNYHKFSEVMNVDGYLVQTVGDLQDALKNIQNSRRPSIVNVIIAKNDHSPALGRFIAKSKKKI
jgi:indolepyruvate decarboxylase